MKKLLAIVTLSLAALSCGGSNNSSIDASKTLSFNAVAEGVSFDPQVATDGNTLNIIGLVHRGLTYTTPDGKVEPALASSWDVSEDGLTWTFHLRDGIKWSDGSPITAEDFVTGFLRGLDPKVASDYAFILFPIKNAQKYSKGEVSADQVGVKALDAKTLEVKLENVTPYFGSLASFMTYMPAHKEFIDKTGDQYALEADKLLYSGPYMVKSWAHNSGMTLVRNPYYYAPDEYKFDKINVKYIVDGNAALNAFKNAELDVVSISPVQSQEFKGDSRLKKDALARTRYLAFNMGSKVFSNLHIRKAISLAIDKKELVESVFKGRKDIIYTFTPTKTGINTPDGKDYAETLGPIFPKANLDEAKKELSEGLKELRLDKLPQITLLGDERNEGKKICETIQEQLRSKLGLDIKVDIVTFKDRLAKQSAGQFDFVLTAWGADYQDPMTFLDLFTSDSGNNGPHLKSAEYDGLIKAALSATSVNERMKNLMNAEKFLAREFPIDPLYQENQLHLVNDKLKGAKFGAIGVGLDLSHASKESK